MKIFFDTEFTGLHNGTTLISIGLISENRKIFYAELTDYDEEQCDEWIKKNILSHLYTWSQKRLEDAPYIPNLHVGKRWEIARALRVWFKQFDYVELVSDVCHYDMVLFIDLFENAFNLPKNVGASCYDINQDIARYYGISQTEAFNKSREEILYDLHEDNIKGEKHNSLYDATVIKTIYEKIHNNNYDFKKVKA